MINLSKNQTYTAEITGYSSAGMGICKIEGRAVFVKGTIIGETWEILILKVTSNAVYGKGINCISPSPSRAEPTCKYYGKCGGCDTMHMTYDEEKRFKLQRVNDAFSHIGGLDFSAGEIIGAEDCLRNYRNKAIYQVNRGKDNSAITGFFREHSHDVVPVEYCEIQTELSNRTAAAFREFMDISGVTPYDEKTGKGQIRNVYTRCSIKKPQSVACIVVNKGLHEHTDLLVEVLRKKCPELTGIVLCVNKTRGNTVLTGKFHTLWGSDIIEDELCGLSFRISPLSFYQVNPVQTEKLYNQAVEYAAPTGNATVLDLYCGTGTISLCLAKKAKTVYGAEIIEDAVINARQNAAENGIENVEFICGDAADAAAQLAERGIYPDAIVVDPPRKGLSAEAIDEIVKIAPQRVVYVSCNPATLARDMAVFSGKGYAPSEATAVDMFPRTAHVETVVLMTRVNN